MIQFSPASAAVLIAIIGGSGIPVQIAVNTALKQKVGSPMLVTAISFIVGTIATLLYCWITKVKISPEGFAQTSWWMYAGGLFGALYVWSATISGHQLGAAVAMALAISAQMIIGLAVDGFGIGGVSHQPINLLRLGGAGFICLGTMLLVIASKYSSTP